jgi:hypothetical protein
MDKRHKIRLGALCVCMAAAVPAGATDVAITAKLGSLGLGVEGTFGLTEQFNARLGLNKFTYDRSETVSDVDYDLDLELQSISVLADWHPFRSKFRFTAGLMSNSNELVGSSATQNVEINGVNYGTVGLDAKLDFDSTAPYFGIGWGNAVAADKGWGFNVDLGVMYQGSGSVTLTATGPDAGSVPQDELAAEERDFEDDIKGYKYYPVFSFGASYKF